MFRSRSLFGGGLWKPKNVHSLEHLKFLYNVLSKNHIVSEHNRGLLVETLRSIAEILIWGDQNDSSVFDFFLEKNMLSFFLKILKQKCGSYVCVQLLQTLNILFENIRNETSLYYLLSNNHVNSIIVHKFDFSDEEVMAYYISFLKTLSLKLNGHTIHFFYNEHTNDFPLYTEAIKFFKHPESMVRIAVRTLTLNVYRVDDTSMLQFIRDKTAAPYFSNLVWFIGNHILELDNCVRNDADHQSQNRLSDLVAEHLDHLHYLNDILCLKIDDLNQVLSDHLLNKLFIPLYVYSLIQRKQLDEKQKELTANKPHVSIVVSLFLLSQVFLIVSYRPLVHTLAAILLKGDFQVFSQGASEKLADQMLELGLKPAFVAPSETLEKSLETQDSQSETTTDCDTESKEGATGTDSNFSGILPKGNFTDEEKEKLAFEPSLEPICDKPFLDVILNTLQCNENDYSALFSLCLLYALAHNKGIDKELLDTVLCPSERSESRNKYNIPLVERLIKIINSSCQSNCKIRLVTLELATRLLAQLVIKNATSVLHDGHLAAVEGAREQSTSLLRNFYKSEDFFLDMFEDEYNEMKKKPLNVEYLTMDANILLPPTGTPMTGIEFSKRLPCGEVERARRAIRVFFLIRELSFGLGCHSSSDTNNGSNSSQLLPLTNPQTCVQVDHALDLNNSDLIACTVVTKDSHKLRRFLVIDAVQLILVEPETRRLGWGIAKFVGFLQDIEVIGDKDDSRCLHITVHRPLSSSSTNRVPLLSAKFIFDDHIRCMAAKQRLTKGRLKARQKKMHMIARLLDLPTSVQPCPSPPVFNLLAQRHEASRLSRQTHRPLFMDNTKVPGFATALRRENIPSSTGTITRGQSPGKIRTDSQDRSMLRGGGVRAVSRDSSPRTPRPRSEEIPLEDMAKNKPWSASNNGESSRTNHHLLDPSPKRRHSSHSSPHRLSLAPINGQQPLPSTSSQLQDPQSSLNSTNQAILHSIQRLPEETSFTQPQEISALPSSSSNGDRKSSQAQQKRRGIIETV